MATRPGGRPAMSTTSGSNQRARVRHHRRHCQSREFVEGEFVDAK
jgi:hypothetical protein